MARINLALKVITSKATPELMTLIAKNNPGIAVVSITNKEFIVYGGSRSMLFNQSLGISRVLNKYESFIQVSLKINTIM